MSDEDEVTKMVDDAAERLREHFDAVIILCSRDAPGQPHQTQHVTRGRGNWFAQRGMMREVLQNDHAAAVADYIKAKENE